MTRARTNADQARTESVESIPHIIPGVLYPAVAGKDLSGTALGGSYTYGTAHTDGRSYYYTDIKGSKPIKDPRIGGHFGSQRHKAKSVQLLEQETATHGSNVYSVDGREWFRAVSSDLQGWSLDLGTFIGSSNHTFTTFFEIVGYFNDFNCISRTKNDRADDINVTVNGGTTRNSANTDKLAGKSVENSPLRNRYVDAGSVINHGDSDVTSDLGTTPRINTIKIEAINTGSEYWQFFGVELIAQDTTSTANRSKIQIPSQNVVSYGKKFTVSGTPHYDPFNGFTSGNLAAVQALIDTDTSLGMANWLSSSTYYRPFNGGRVVKWVDSSGNIKTSVTMMPPNAQNVGGTASNAHTLGNANDQTINFDTTTLANATPLSEVAKTFNWREFGNGSANGGTSSGTYADASMLKDGVDDDVAYVMDDGLTSFSAETIEADSDQLSYRFNANDAFYVTFIGTGISIEKKTSDTQAGSDSYTYNLDGVALTTYSSSNATHPKFINLAQNLPYGTHILKVNRSGHSNVLPFWKEFTYHQPKMPPIPEDAVVLADYMLMADFVGVSTSSGGIEVISKGTRWVSPSRDYFYDENCSTTLSMTNQSSGIFTIGGFYMGVAAYYNDSPTQAPYAQLPYFGTTVDCRIYADRFSAITEPINSTSLTTTSVSTTTWSGRQRVTGQTLGLNGCRTTGHTSGGGSEGGANQNNFNHMGFEIHTPIHTSSHYQTFETPYLHELVGGDRNMEQNNLIVTPDGKTWDEVTRDTSYLGNIVFSGSKDQSQNTLGNYILDEWRGTGGNASASYFNKDFAIAYDRWICLKDGWYKIFHQFHTNQSINTSDYCRILVNGVRIGQVYQSDQDYVPMGMNVFASAYINRGDYVQIYGGSPGSDEESYIFQIIRL